MEQKNPTSVFPKDLTTVESAPSSDQDVRTGSVHVAVDHKAERRLVWSFDLRILPVLAAMYFFNALDKGNIGKSGMISTEGPSCTELT